MEKVSNIVHVVNLPHDIQVSWDAVVGATSYTAELRSGNQAIESKSVAVPEVPFAALVIGQIYEILITATDGIETSEPTRYVVYLSERDWLSPPPDLAYTELETGDGFTVTWGASPSALSYRMVVEPFGVQDPEEVFNGPATSPHVISGLPAEKLFRIYVYPVNGTEEGQPSTIVGWVQPDVGESRPTAHRLFPAEVQGSYYLLYQPYIQNMRPLRANEDFWRIDDRKSYCQGPEDIGQTVTVNRYEWVAQPMEGGIHVFRTDLDNPVFYEYPTTEPVEAISLGFDQVGSIILAYETASGSFLYWFDNLANDYVTISHPGYITPALGYTAYLQPLNTDMSERILVAADPANNKITYWRQSDRFGTAYHITSSEGTVLEILGAGRSSLGGFTIAAAIQMPDGTSKVKSFTAPDTRGWVFGDLSLADRIDLTVSFVDEEFVVGTNPSNAIQVLPDSGTVVYTATGELETLLFTEKARFTHLTNNDTSINELNLLSIDPADFQYVSSGALDTLTLTEKARFTTITSESTTPAGLAPFTTDSDSLVYNATGELTTLSLVEKAQFISAGPYVDSGSLQYTTNGQLDQLILTQVV